LRPLEETCGPQAELDVARRDLRARAPRGAAGLEGGRASGRGDGRAGPSVHFDAEQAQEVLDEGADWTEDAFTLSPRGRRDLARSVLALSRVLAPGWGIRAAWVGDPLAGEQAVTAPELAGLVERSRLDRSTLYRVR